MIDCSITYLSPGSGTTAHSTEEGGDEIEMMKMRRRGNRLQHLSDDIIVLFPLSKQ
jgi:hypothetical protein